VASPGLVWPHPVDPLWLSDREPECRELPELPGSGIRVLYFCLHSFWRKGGDILARALSILSRRGVKFSLVVRSAETSGDVSVFSRFGAVFITRFLSKECLKALYAWADVVPVPSRGGGWERNALEALACGTPALVPEVGPWMEYVHPRLRPLLAVAVEGWDVALPGNPVHVGVGPRASALDLAARIERAPEIRDEVARYRQWLGEVFGADAVAGIVERDVRWLLGEGAPPAPGRPRFRRAR
jgi:glycosyltransferase involved in cell wall biosynthesis